MALDIKQIEELEKWYALFNDPEFAKASPEDRYDARLELADDMLERGVIDEGEWRELIEEAAAIFADELG
ncbi:hypothetical protein C4K26_2184 [Pseudomonas chlororaphis]|uniref:hypothetical protein n=1 Tax=Pseudomonas chlororaphis TaxID=587753 RepID=UPI000F5872E2|nr:hypothetical protein [Pseudomonas chlororaphis]AZD07587.1 hypothetical protein C4K26_2184 [Pseudomonas chlororaphis]